MPDMVPASARFTVRETVLPGVRTVQRQIRGDARGSLSRLFCAEELGAAGWPGPVAQVNHTVTRRAGTVRGLHFQFAPWAETKLVSCVRGAVWDVVVDLRPASPGYLQWFAQELSATNQLAMLVPAGCAHGFQTLLDDTEMLYLHSAPYQAQAEGGLQPFDPALAIPWPLPLTELSERDEKHPLLTPEFKGVLL